ncbi:hypothetical protein ACHWQZ_G007460 [Mnemiopsis leidyi]
MKVGGPIFLKVLCATTVLQVNSFLRGPRIINMTTANKIMNPYFQSKYFSIDFFLTALFEDQSCTDLTVNGMGISPAIRSFDIFIRNSASYERLMTMGADQTTQYIMCLRDESEVRRNTCAIPDSWQCDGFSACLNDECDCDKDSFKCADGKGCITIKQVCDSRPDCLDLSDEIPCQDYQQCMRKLRPMLNQDVDTDDSRIAPNCNKKSYRKIEDDEVSQLQKFFFGPEGLQARLLDNEAQKSSYQISSTRLAECRDNNIALGFHCKRLELIKSEIAYKCTKTSSIEAMYSYANITNSSTFVFCDGIKNCKNGIDEHHCPGMFYCVSDNQPVRKERTCDSVADCADSSDECANCQMSSVFSSQTHLVGHNFMLFVLMAETCGIILLNSYGLIYHGKRVKNVERTSLQIDIIQCITLTVYDIMMAVYLLIICWKHWEYRGEYCSHDVYWRSSPLCKIAGAIIYAASHGALQVVVATSLCRNYQCRNVLSGKRIKLALFISGFTVLNLFNLAMAIIPLIATFSSSSEWADMFVHEFFFKNNPMIRRGTKSDLASLVSLYKRQETKITTEYSTPMLFQQLRNMTAKGELFSADRMTSVGLYGTSSLCYPNLFSTESSIFGFKVVYMIKNSIYMIVIIFCYAFIVKEFFKSRKAVAAPPAGSPPVAGQEDSNPKKSLDQGFYLSFKVSIVIGSQLVCWLPLHGAMIASFIGFPPSNIITDIFIVNIAPLNAIMNPLLHTDLLSKFMNEGLPLVKGKISSMKEGLSRLPYCNKAIGPRSDEQENIEIASYEKKVGVAEGVCEE